jgi:protein-tyrosine-phosphatase
VSPHLLFVCTGNTCRSPLAEAMARAHAASRGLDIIVSSAGTSAWQDAHASDASILVGLERKLDLSTHRARALTRALVDEASLILGMAAHHVAAARALGGEGKVFLLTDYAANAATGRAIHDPFGEALESYRRMADELGVEIPRVISRLAGELPTPGRK